MQPTIVGKIRTLCAKAIRPDPTDPTTPSVAAVCVYNDLVPLSSETHANYKMRAVDSAPWLVSQHAVPITVEEFPLIQRNMPIVFTLGEESVPIALLANATSLGAPGKPALDIALDRLPRTAVVGDLIYVPPETPLLAAARARGNVTVNGLGLLLHQARPAFQAWFGVMPEITPALRAAIAATF